MILQFARNSRMAVAGIRPLSSGNRVRGRTSSTSTRTSYEFSRLATQYDEVSRHCSRTSVRLKLKDDIAAMLTKPERRM